MNESTAIYIRLQENKSGHFLHSGVIEKGYPEEVTFKLGPVALTEWLGREGMCEGPQGAHDE